MSFRTSLLGVTRSLTQPPAVAGETPNAIYFLHQYLLSPLRGSDPSFRNPGARKKRSPPAIVCRPSGAQYGLIRGI